MPDRAQPINAEMTTGILTEPGDLELTTSYVAVSQDKNVVLQK